MRKLHVDEHERRGKLQTSILKLHSVKIGGSLARNVRFDAPKCLVSSLWFSCGTAVWGKLQNISLSNVSKQVVMSFCMAGAALCDIPTCLITRRKSFFVAGAILLRRFHKMSCSFRGRRAILEISVSSFCVGSTSDVSHRVLYTPHSTLHTPPFTLHTPHFTFHTLHSTLQTLQFTLHTLPLHALHSTLFTRNFALRTLHPTLHTLHFTPPLYTLHCQLNTPHSTLYILHSTLHTLHSTLYTSDSTLYTYTPHSTLHTLHFALHTLHCTLHTTHFTLYTEYFTCEALPRLCLLLAVRTEVIHPCGGGLGQTELRLVPGKVPVKDLGGRA